VASGTVATIVAISVGGAAAIGALIAGSTAPGTGGGTSTTTTTGANQGVAIEAITAPNTVGAIALGQANMSASLPVVIAGNQTIFPINVGKVGGSTYALGANTMANSQPVTIASDQTAIPLNLTQWAGAALNAANPVPVTTPAPAPTGAHAVTAVEGIANGTPVNVTPNLAGTGATYTAGLPDAEASPNVVTATTTKVVAGVVGQRIYVFGAWEQASATESAATIQWETGTTTTTPCDTSTTKLWTATATGMPATSGNITSAYSGNGQANALGGIQPSQIPYPLPVQWDLCAVTAGTTIAANLLALYNQH